MLPLRISVLDGDVLSIYVAKLAQSQPNCLGTGGLTSWVDGDRYPIRGDFLRLLRLGTPAPRARKRLSKTPAILDFGLPIFDCRNEIEIAARLFQASFASPHPNPSYSRLCLTAHA